MFAICTLYSTVYAFCVCECEYAESCTNWTASHELRCCLTVLKPLLACGQYVHSGWFGSVDFGSVGKFVFAHHPRSEVIFKRNSLETDYNSWQFARCYDELFVWLIVCPWLSDREKPILGRAVVFKPPAEAICFRVVRPCRCPCVRPCVRPWFTW